MIAEACYTAEDCDATADDSSTEAGKTINLLLINHKIQFYFLHSAKFFQFADGYIINTRQY